VSPRGKLLPLHGADDRAELSDDALIAACATGDDAARSRLFERHVDAVHRFVGRMQASDDGEVDDLVQATFVEAFRSTARYRGPSVRAWLYGIAANLTRAYARREIRRKRAHQAIASVDRLPATLDMVRRDVLARLPAALTALPHDLRTVFILVDLEQQRGCEVAAALRIPEGTVWRRLYRARQALRITLEGGRP
jgi:RNA polymerase sigma-70 factor (ECF subfamily)